MNKVIRSSLILSTKIRSHKRLLLKTTSSIINIKFFNTTPTTSKKRDLNETNNKKDTDYRDLFIPVDVKPNLNEDFDVGAEITGNLSKDIIKKILNDFFSRKEVRLLSLEAGLTEKMFHETMISFRRFCLQSSSLPVDLHIKFSDIANDAANPNDIFPYFYRHAKETYPHLLCMDQLKKISDLGEPANWYPEARAMKRKIIYHSGPTNSGKTYSALKAFQECKSGLYCGPLKLLAYEVATKTNNHAGESICDMIVGDDRRYVKESGESSSHCACTIEMVNLGKRYDIVVIDEIQMIADQQRGWAWTRAFLGICADEVHLCGDTSAVDLIENLCLMTGDDFQLKTYKRLTKLEFSDKALTNLRNVKSGDCIVCFSKVDIFNIVRELEKLNIECAVIYGSMPPNVKLEQARKFNDPNNSCKVLVATDAIGMGLNLNIKRVIFYSVNKTYVRDNSTFSDLIGTSQALQIAGRAGRFNTQFPDGIATTYNQKDFPLLKSIISKPIEPSTKAGLHPTQEQIELFAYNLPHHPMSSLIDIFVTICKLDDSKYFMCQINDMKSIASMIDNIPLPLKARYTFSSAPVDLKNPFNCNAFMQFVTIFSRNEPILVKDVEKIIEWPLKMPKTIMALNHAESIFDALDLYLWLSYRFSEMFPDAEAVREIRKVVDQLIHNGIQQIIAGRSTNKQIDTQQIRRNENYKKFLQSQNEQKIKNGSLILNNNSQVMDFLKLFSSNSVDNLKTSNKKDDK